MKTLHIRNLPPDTTDEEVTDLFSQHGKVFSVKLVRDVFKGTCRGFGQVDMEGHEARAAMAALDGSSLRGNSLKVQEDRGPRGGRGGRRRQF
ncbi:MAG: RNA recognition motif domain-containing protein [Gammaproteobacteria bacterium]